MKQIKLSIVDRKTCQAKLRRTENISDSFILENSLICAGGDANKVYLSINNMSIFYLVLKVLLLNSYETISILGPVTGIVKPKRFNFPMKSFITYLQTDVNPFFMCQDTCKGDGGGPLVCLAKQSQLGEKFIQVNLIAILVNIP